MGRRPEKPGHGFNYVRDVFHRPDGVGWAMKLDLLDECVIPITSFIPAYNYKTVIKTKQFLESKGCTCVIVQDIKSKEIILKRAEMPDDQFNSRTVRGEIQDALSHFIDFHQKFMKRAKYYKIINNSEDLNEKE
jgi:hypothetical protein